jgi:hypothetical protein
MVVVTEWDQLRVTQNRKPPRFPVRFTVDLTGKARGLSASGEFEPPSPTGPERQTWSDSAVRNTVAICAKMSLSGRHRIRLMRHKCQ